VKLPQACFLLFTPSTDKMDFEKAQAIHSLPHNDARNGELRSEGWNPPGLLDCMPVLLVIINFMSASLKTYQLHIAYSKL